MMIRLSPTDYYFLRPGLYSMRFLFHFQTSLEADLLRKALAKVKSVIPVASAKLLPVDGEVFLDCGYEIPVTEVALSGELNIQDENQREPLVEMVTNTHGESLVRMTLTKTPSGTLLGVGFSHVVGDGTSFFHFMRELARAYRGLNPEQGSFNERNFLRINHSQNYDLYESTGYKPLPASSIEVETVRTFYESQHLSDLRRAAHRNGNVVTNNDLIMADLVKRFYQDFEDENGSVLIRCPVDYRSLLNLPKGFFGNAILDARTNFTRNEISNSSIEELAKRIRQSIHSIDCQLISKALTSLENFRRDYGNDSFQKVSCPGLVVTNLTKVPLKDLDFGGGPPSTFYPVGMFPNLALIRAAPGGEEVILRKPKSVT